MTKLEWRVERAFDNCTGAAEYARDALEHARFYRCVGNREKQLDFLEQTAHWRARALYFYHQYRTYRALAELEVV